MSLITPASLALPLGVCLSVVTNKAGAGAGQGGRGNLKKRIETK